MTYLEYDGVGVPDGGVLHEHELRVSDVKLQFHVRVGGGRGHALQRQRAARAARDPRFLAGTSRASARLRYIIGPKC